MQELFQVLAEQRIARKTLDLLMNASIPKNGKRREREK
jgi:hypothetical protein